MELNKRQKYILSLFKKIEQLSQSEIQNRLKNIREVGSKITILRDLDVLIREGFIERLGGGRATRYQLAGGKLLYPIDADEYFQKGPDEREGVRERFDFEIFGKIKKYSLFTEEELMHLRSLNEQYRKNLHTMDPALIQKEFERLTIELSWKSSQLEGNTYTLLETEILLTKGEPSLGHTEEETTMILNHKNALEYIRSNPEGFKRISISLIENIHTLLMRNLSVPTGVRERPVGITGTRYKPLDNIFEIREALEKMCELVNTLTDVFSKAFAILALISYIQPFYDGNKRTSRLSSNALLLSYGSCPLSYRNVNDVEYKKAVLLVYEQQNFWYLKKLFMEQVQFSVNTYFQ